MLKANRPNHSRIRNRKRRSRQEDNFAQSQPPIDRAGVDFYRLDILDRENINTAAEDTGPGKNATRRIHKYGVLPTEVFAEPRENESEEEQNSKCPRLHEDHCAQHCPERSDDCQAGVQDKWFRATAEENFLDVVQ